MAKAAPTQDRLSTLLMTDLGDHLAGVSRVSQRKAGSRLLALGGAAWFRADSRPDGDPLARGVVARADGRGFVTYEDLPRAELPAGVPHADGA